MNSSEPHKISEEDIPITALKFEKFRTLIKQCETLAAYDPTTRAVTYHHPEVSGEHKISDDRTLQRAVQCLRIEESWIITIFVVEIGLTIVSQPTLS
jgi:hypothetical protein